MGLTIMPSDATLGARVTDVDLDALDDETWRALEAAFHEHAVLVFPGQRLSADAQVAIAKRLGEIAQTNPARR